MNHWPECFLNWQYWSILGARRFKFVQLKSPDSQMALPPERGIFQKIFFWWTIRSNTKLFGMDNPNGM